MVIQNTSPINFSRKTSEVKTQGDYMFFARLLVKWFGFVSMTVLGIAAISPDTLNIPMDWRPWVFVAAIFWFLAFCSGLFNL